MPPPERWEEYSALGSVIPGTKFIAFKVPLKPEICRNLPEEESFSPQQLIENIKAQGKRLGLVVDLTFTRKYYNGKAFTSCDIQYEKIFTQGHEVPSDDVVQRFHDVVEEFSKRNTDKDVLIGVHCTHGINRTGYLVCRYMIEKLNIVPEEAILLFAQARGHPIERVNYISDLKQRPKECIGDSSHAEAAANESWRESTWTDYSQQNGAKGQNRWQDDTKSRVHINTDRHWRNSYYGGRSRCSETGMSQSGFQSIGWDVSLQRDAAATGSFSGRAGGSGNKCGSDVGYISPLDALEASRPVARWGSGAKSGWVSGKQEGDYRCDNGWRGGGQQRRDYHSQPYSPYRGNPYYNTWQNSPLKGSSGYRFRDVKNPVDRSASGRSDRDLNWRSCSSDDKGLDIKTAGPSCSDGGWQKNHRQSNFNATDAQAKS